MNNFPSEFKNNSTESVGLSFIKVYNLWHKAIKDQLKKVNLTHPQFTILASLGYLSQSKEEINQVDISKQADIDVMTVSTIIRNLEKSELLIRQASLSDTRAKSIKLTDSGANLLSKALPLVENIDHTFFGTLDQDQSTFNLLLLKLIKENLR
ncbi:MarR family winged helix-turn-helix transcriptional regulator [Listeria sp. PSOL-1]|uniref:MarR family winged helix-turn-helix transcriptional regulator n=1 Tax=Listeria sp. PSOL-1 TaxID=1844999 RepID=UPI0013D85F4F|nr:MarR family transcriptional regulator [Listeria sp. PSOL-1]